MSVSQQSNFTFSVNFSNCLWKEQSTPTGITTSSIFANEDPLFDSVNNSTLYYDFHLQPGSPALGAGINTGLLIDLDGNPRPTASPDLGCYQRQ